MKFPRWTQGYFRIQGRQFHNSKGNCNQESGSCRALIMPLSLVCSGVLSLHKLASPSTAQRDLANPKLLSLHLVCTREAQTPPNSLEEESFQLPLTHLPSHGQINSEQRFHYVALGTRVLINFNSKEEFIGS